MGRANSLRQTHGCQECFLVGRENHVGDSNMDGDTNTSNFEKLSSTDIDKKLN